MPPKIYKVFNNLTDIDKVLPDRLIVSDCNSECKKVANFIDSFLGTLLIQPIPDGIEMLVFPDKC